ncbi:HepT-like ribonuclease domain-containing protein [Chthonomonas calidirosea]|uniref:HepT-like ribonuclease domain-containing protein n=1 Tax=Chthonomonas calidirosea TaxID=454171 RepID=UPI000948ACFD
MCRHLREINVETKAQISAIPWRKITDMRHRLVCTYFGIDLTFTRELCKMSSAFNRNISHLQGLENPTSTSVCTTAPGKRWMPSR